MPPLFHLCQKIFRRTVGTEKGNSKCPPPKPPLKWGHMKPCVERETCGVQVPVGKNLFVF